MANVSMTYMAGGHNSKMLHYGQHGPFGSYGGIPQPAPREEQNGYVDMLAQPPIFDITAPSSNNMKGSRRFGRVGRVVQRVWKTFGINKRNTTWVNKAPLNPMPQPGFCPSNMMEDVKNPYACSPIPVEEFVEPPWFTVHPENCSEMPGLWQSYPFEVQYFPEEKMVPPNECWGNVVGGLAKSQPLNPEAKEWVPKNHQSKNEIIPAQGDSDGLGGFYEITEKEISSVREMPPGNPEMPKNIAKIVDQSVDKNETLIDSPSLPSELIDVQCQDNVGQSNCNGSLEQLPSYAVVCEKAIVLNSEKDQPEVKQKQLTEILPRFHTSEKRCSPAKEITEVSDFSKPTLPFKTGTKVQKKLSKRFLEDLKASPSSLSSGSYSDIAGSPCGSLSGDSSGSLLCSGIPTAVLPLRVRKDSSESTNSVGGSSTSSIRIGENRSGVEKVRTVSESSFGSVDSLDIEFVEDEMPKEASVPCKLVKGISCAFSLLNGPSDDFEEDDGDDWDEVDSSNCDIDLTSWETFGLSTGLILPVINPKTLQEKYSEECENPKEMSLKEVNVKWSSEIEKDIKGQRSSKVRFAENPQVYPMVAWNFAYRASRKGVWEQCARDRERFQKRVCELESVLVPVLETTHRQNIYENLCAQAS
ncbi:uncharacterized protein LOC143028398 [Oratosquilla oratoria]|uniref:uncharacterized protein LOC143028398 n=1 Tax=Oratosquilla oratoria TaxID=337810 RepID=UPI003F75E148